MVALLLASTATAAGPDAPSGLLCELLGGPTVATIDDPQPEFCWIVPDNAAGRRQSAYQVQVAPASGDAAPALVWDSGRVESADSVAVSYAGPPLRRGAAYRWRVRVWDAHRAGSPWSAWRPFQLNASPAPLPPAHAVQANRRQPAAIHRRDDGVWFVDFGRAAFGYVELRVESPGRSELLCRFGEKLAGDRIDPQPGGTIRTLESRFTAPTADGSIAVRPPAVERNTTGAAIRLPESTGVVAPFRYVEIEGLPASARVADCVQVWFAYPFDRSAAHFRCSDDNLNAVWDLCKYSIEATTFCGVYVDGDRERIPYEGDAYINQLCHYALDREYALARLSHEYLLDYPTWPLEWQQHSLLIAWADYLHTGDADSLRSRYHQLRDVKLLERYERADGLIDASLAPGPDRPVIDWPPAERDGFDLRPVDSVVNALHYHCLVLMERIAKTLGHADDAARFSVKRQRLYATYNQLFFDDQQGLYVDSEGSAHCSAHASFFPLAVGLVPVDRRPALLAFLKQRGMACSVYGAQHLIEALYRAGESQHALDLQAADTQRSWVNMLRSGSTITLEAWDQQFKPNLDWNHAWGAAPANLIPRFLVGVRPVEPGFRQLLVQPQPASLQQFSSLYPTIRGPVSVEYQRTADGYTLEVSLPTNAQAYIGLPRPAAGEFRVANAKGQAPALAADAPANACDAPTLGWIGPLTGGRHQWQVRPAAAP